MEKKMICLLLRILRGYGVSCCSAETFRLAKHDQAEAVIPMWKFLKSIFDILYYPQSNKRNPEDSEKVPTNNDQNDTISPQLLLFVKHKFHKLGYESQDFYQLSTECLSSGSRDLLLAFAWLLCHVDLIGPLLEEISFLETKTKSMSESIPLKGDIPSEISSGWDIKDCVQHLTMVHGKLMLTCRHLHSLQRERNRLQHKLHEFTQGVSLRPGCNHLTSSEAQLLRKSKETMIMQLERTNSRIEDVLKWKESENIFWKWMESVVMLKVNGSRETVCDCHKCPKDEESVCYSKPPPFLGITTQEQQHLREAKEKLNDTLIQHGPIIRNLETVWLGKQSGLLSEEKSRIQSEFHAQVERLEASHSDGNFLKGKKLSLAPQRKSHYTHCFDPSKPQAPHSVANVAGNHRGIIQNGCLIEEEIDRINKQTLNLKREFEKNFEFISNEFQNLICIPLSGPNL